MERSKALALLGLDESATEENVTDALDQAVFKVRDFFLRNAVIPLLAQSRVEKCVQLSDVAQTLEVSSLGVVPPAPQLLPQGTDLEPLIRGHVENLMRCRNAMASTLDPDSVAQLGHLMANLQSEYMTAFLSLTQPFAEDQHPAAVPAREEADWMALLAAARAANQSPGSDVLLRDLVVKERARMTAMLTANLPTQR
jgi:hypothetical protein